MLNYSVAELRKYKKKVINIKLIFKVLGALLYIETAMMIVCLLASVWYGEDDFVAFAISSVVTMMGALVLRFMGITDTNTLSRKDAYLVVTLSWITFSLFGTLPFLTSGHVHGFTNAFFEAMSGFTTTGASIINDVEALPHGLLFFRSLMQWIGGLGIVFFTIALLPSMTGGSVRVFAAEATGPIKSKLHPRLSTSAKWIWSIYIFLTIACFMAYWAFGMTGFDALNYGMTTTATGGFSTHNNSTEFFNNPCIEYSCVFFCFASGVNFVLLWTAVSKHQLGRLFKSVEFKTYAGMIAVSTLIIIYELMTHNGYSMGHALRSALFCVVSFVTTTGIYNDDVGLWPHVTWIVLAACMFMGGMSGSTSGGMKCIRGVMLIKMVRNEFRQLLHPNAVLPVRIDGSSISQQKNNSLMALLGVYAILVALGIVLLMLMNVDFVNAINIAITSLSNVGPTLGVTIGPSMSWDMLPPLAKWICAFYMLLGRLEIFTVLILFSRAFWREN